jgi:hypothetical protein
LDFLDLAYKVVSEEIVEIDLLGVEELIQDSVDVEDKDFFFPVSFLKLLKILLTLKAISQSQQDS